jgi:NADH-quinone oxidoreductase subunit L
MHFDYSIVWLVPLFPLIGFLFNGFFGAQVPKMIASVVACVALLLSFLVSVYIFLMVRDDPSQHIAYLAPWLSIPAFGGVPAVAVNWEALVDPLTSLMLLVITGVGGLIHLYSTGYMAADKGLARFFTYLNLFIVFMLLLVMGNNMLMMFVGWEGVGLCSYLLVGFFYDKPSAAAAALKAMVVNRVGDVGVLIAMFLSLKWFGTLDFYRGAAGVPGILDLAHTIVRTGLLASPAISAAISLICLMTFWGCTGKSAQLPLYTWLPDAMEGPTPVSALIHAATMVTAGVYLVSRMHSLFELSDIAMSVVAVVGMATALFAASIGLVQNDIKRILAYSTMSQLGYMFAACGVGAFAAGMFHVMTHAFFKACLFLGSGVVIHAMEHAIHERHEKEGHGAAGSHDTHREPGAADPDDPQDVRNMGGLKKRLPKAHWTMLVSTFAIAGIPFFSGFFSKDEILGQVAGYSPVLWLVGVITAALTAFYMMRLMYKTFYGSTKTDDAKHAHESGAAMIGVIMVLGILAIFGGYVGVPAFALPNIGFMHSFFAFLAPATGTLPDRVPIISDGMLLSISSLVAIVFVLLSYSSYRAKDGRDLVWSPEAKPHIFVYQFMLHKYYVDELYYKIFTVGGRAISNAVYSIVDVKIVDGLVNGVGWLTGQIGAAFRSLQTGYVRNYAFSMMIGVIFLLIGCYLGFRHIGLH